MRPTYQQIGSGFETGRSASQFSFLKTRHVDRRCGTASMQLVMASAVAIPIAGGILFLGFRICSYVFSALSGLLAMPFV